MNELMRNRFLTLAIAACVVSVAGCAAKREADASGVVQSGVVEEGTVEATAVVKAVDEAKRTVTVETADGQTTTLDVGPEVKNFDQIDPGDEIKVAYYESIAFDVKVPGKATPGVTVTEGAETAEPGEKPGAVGARVVTVTATIEDIDHNPPSVTLRGPEGGTRKIRVRNPAHLSNVKIGDLVEIQYTQAVAIMVQETKDAGDD